MTDNKKDSTPALDPDNVLLPWERNEPRGDKVVEENLFALLGSDPDFQEDEDAEDADELESDDEDEDESDEQESDDGEEEDDLDDEEEDEDSEEDEDDEDGEDEDEDQEGDPELHEVKVQGETLKVTLEEALAGYSRTEDYTRKRQADVEEHATEMTGVREVRETYDAHLAQLEAIMEQMTPAEPDWDKLRKDNPEEYAAEKVDHAERLTAIAKVAKERERVQEEAGKENLAAQAVYLQGEMDKLVEEIPEWKNEATRETAISELRNFAQTTYGFSDEELNAVADHRVLLLLRENMQGREKKKSGKKEIRRKSKGAKKMRPGTTRTPKRKANRNRKQANQRARETLARSGSVQDAALAIENMLGDDD